MIKDNKTNTFSMDSQGTLWLIILFSEHYYYGLYACTCEFSLHRESFDMILVNTIIFTMGVLQSSYSYHHKIMNLIIQHLGAANKPSPISEGVVEIGKNSQPCKGINLTTQHTQARRAPRVEKMHNMIKEMIRAHLTLVHVFHAYASANTPWVAHALSHCTPVRYGKIASISGAHNATQFRDSICPICISTFQMLVQ